ncbi:hypothetical protein VC03_04600 [Sneathia vaginalis]|uniref:Uncharacterized protein n=1 Tax=Sneathia vaginalis TaxID=187101 RepID=A0A0E3ZAM3_9FUSO|nr:hypothetical protein [Sneathia vaginalis]AKC95770.1 hypothetical protein VC03_04600 [Sneathia vaginalis]
MKKLIMILMMMITFVGMATNKPKDNFDYDKYVGYYTYEGEESTSKKIEIRKLKNGKYILIDYTYMYGSGYNGKLPYFKLISKNGKFYDKDKIQYILKGDKLIMDYGNEKYAYKKDSKQEIEEFTSGEDYKIAKFYDGDSIQY